jgi:DNA topoisomerase-2
VDAGTIKDYKDLSTDKIVNIQVVLQSEDDDIDKILKLSTYLSINNMNLFDEKEQLTHYNEVYEICDHFIKIRLDYYDIRKKHLILQLEKDTNILRNKFTYITELLNGTIDLRKKTIQQIQDILESKSYIKVDDNYNYLVKMTMDSVCEENVAYLKKEYEDKLKELEDIKNTTIQQMWIKELTNLEKFL